MNATSECSRKASDLQRHRGEKAWWWGEGKAESSLGPRLDIACTSDLAAPTHTQLRGPGGTPAHSTRVFLGFTSQPRNLSMRIRGEAVAQAEDGSTLMLYRLVPGTGAAGSVETSCPFWRRRAIAANSCAETGPLDAGVRAAN